LSAFEIIPHRQRHKASKMNQMSTVWKVAITVVAFFVSLGIASAAFSFFLGYHPAWTVIAGLVIVSPLVFVLWRDRLT
jgi:hypothetical protein